MSSPMALLQNAKLTFSRVLSEVEDPKTGNLIPQDVEILECDCYLKRKRPQLDRKAGANTATAYVEGYAIDPLILPDWAKSDGSKIECFIDGLGPCFFEFGPKVHVVKSLVESVAGSQLQGTITREGGWQ